MAEHGYIQLGKYGCARDDILHYLCTNDWAEGSFGNVDEYGSYVWMISNTAEDVSMENGEFNSVLSGWLEWNESVIDSPELRAELVGHFVVTTVDSGFVYITAYDTEEARNAAYTAAEDAWGEWNEDEDEDHGPSRIQEENDYKFGPDRL